MLKTNSFLSANDCQSGPKKGKKQHLCVFEPRFLLAFVVAGFVGAQSAAGQAPAEKEITTQEVPSQFTPQVQRNMVLVKVVVRDSKGNPVPGLRKEDFRLFDNGKPQVIDQFGLESSSRASTLPAAVTAREAGEEAPAGREAAGALARNYLALYFDDIQMAFQDTARARGAADRYLAARLTPADRAGVFTSSGQGNLDFTELSRYRTRAARHSLIVPARKRDTRATADGTPALRALPDTPSCLDFAARPPDT
jgi:hypothetical protein